MADAWRKVCSNFCPPEEAAWPQAAVARTMALRRAPAGHAGGRGIARPKAARRDPRANLTLSLNLVRDPIAIRVLRLLRQDIDVIIHAVLVQIRVAPDELQEGMRGERPGDVFFRLGVPVLGAGIGNGGGEIGRRRREKADRDAGLAVGRVAAFQPVVARALAGRDPLSDLALVAG